MLYFDKKGKLSPRYVGSYVIRKQVGKVAYKLDLSFEITMVHLVFHVSVLRKFVVDPSSIMPLEEVGIEENLTYEEVSVEILDWQVKKLRNKEVSCVNVLWRNQLVKSVTWEVKLLSYPSLKALNSCMIFFMSYYMHAYS